MKKTTFDFPIIRFKGQFRDLRKNGWTFQKLFARNYRCYWFVPSGTPAGLRLWIWQHFGGYMEIGDLFDDSRLILEAIQQKDLPWQDSQIFKKDGPYLRFCIDSPTEDWQTHTIGPWDPHVHDSMFVCMDKEKELGRELTDEETKEVYDNTERYRRFTVNQDLYNYLIKMINDGLIEVEYPNK